MAEDVTEIFAVVVEGSMQGPILMEVEAEYTSQEKARDRLTKMVDGRIWFRGCVVRLEYVEGNNAVLHAMKGMQE
jgi:hypothetical protein